MSLAVPVTPMRTDIQALRGWAILLVLLYHARVGGVDSGFLGVDLFFVISGYLITKLVAEAVEEKRFSFADFYSRRAKRLLPAGYTVFAASSVAAIFILPPAELRDFGTQLVGAVTFTGNIVLWLQTGYFKGGAELKPLLHVWSLAIEEQYYLLLPAVMVWTPRHWWKWGALTVLLCSLGLCLMVVSSEEPSTAFYLLPTRAWELAVGSAGALWLERRTVPRFFYWPAVVVLLLIPCGKFGAHPSWPAMAVCAATLIVILSRRAAPRWLARLGDISYSLYLVHWPLFSFTRNAYIDEPPFTVRIGLIILSLILSVMLYHYVERPVWKSSFRFTPKRVARVVGVSACLVIVGAIAAAGGDEPQRANFGAAPVCAQQGSSFVDLSECRTTERPTVAVWGDSFGMHLVPGLSPMGVVQITQHRCGPMSEVASFNAASYPESSSARCLSFSASAIEFLGSREEIELVVLSSPFVQYLPSEADWVMTVDGLAPASVELVAREVARTVETLRAFGKRVVVVSPPPSVIGFDSAKCHERKRLGLPVFGGGEACGLDAAAYRRDRAEVLMLMGELEDRGVPVIRLDELLCDIAACATSLHGVPVYADAGHLSEEGSRAVARTYRLSRLVENKAQ